MGRRKDGLTELLDLASKLPWKVSAGLAPVSFVVLPVCFARRLISRLGGCACEAAPCEGVAQWRAQQRNHKYRGFELARFRKSRWRELSAARF